MTAWKQTINIKQYLNQEGRSDIVTIAQGIANELKSNSAAFGSLPDRLIDETRKAVELTNDKDYHNLKFNRILAQIYDIADYERIWLGLR